MKSTPKSSESRHPTLMPENHNQGNLLLPHKHNSFKTCFSNPLFSFPFKTLASFKNYLCTLGMATYAKPSPKPAQNNVSKVGTKPCLKTKVSSRPEPEYQNQSSKPQCMHPAHKPIMSPWPQATNQPKQSSGTRTPIDTALPWKNHCVQESIHPGSFL